MSRAARIGSVGIALSLAAGCSLINDPDRSLYMDAGIDGAELDAPVDGGPDAIPDAIPEGGDAGCPDGGCARPESCTGGMDEDRDGLVDCQDFDCVGFPDCCSDEGVPDVDFEERWTGSPSLDGRWQGIPTNAAFPMTEAGREYIDRFTDDDEPTGLIRLECSPLLLGLELDVAFQVQGSTACSDLDCPRYASVLLTAVQPTPVPGRTCPATDPDSCRLLDEIAVTVNARGDLSVTQNRTELGALSREELAVETGSIIDVSLDIGPGVDDRGRAALLATVRANKRGSMTLTVLEQYAFVRQDQLLRSEASGCTSGETAGLYVAVEGRGDGVRVHPLTYAARRCVNPSHFTDSGAETVTMPLGGADDLPFGCWADQGWSAPALAATCDEPGDCLTPRWDLLVEASNAPLTWKGETYVGYAIGQATTFATTWGSWTPAPPVGPRAGRNPPVPPECAMGLLPACGDPFPVAMCDSLRSVREPTVLPRTAGGPRDPIASMVIGYAFENADMEDVVERDRFAITLHNVSSSATDPVTMLESATVLRPDDMYAEDCVSLRDPSLSSATRGVGHYWMLFTCCLNETCSDSEIRYVQYQSDVSGLLRAAGRWVVRAADLGAGYTRVFGPEAVVEFTGTAPDDTATLRLWFLARQASGRVVVMLAQGVTEDYHAMTTGVFAFPTQLELYGANPVLAADDPALGPCERGCDFLGFTVVRDPSTFSDMSRSVQTYRFVVARRVQLTAGGIEYQLVPIDQLWVHP